MIELLAMLVALTGSITRTMSIKMNWDASYAHPMLSHFLDPLPKAAAVSCSGLEKRLLYSCLGALNELIRAYGLVCSHCAAEADTTAGNLT